MNWYKQAQQNNDPWFQGTKVVDTAGDPLVVYHGTNAVFKSFKPEYKQKNWGTAYSDGFYFTPLKDTALNYAELAGGNNIIEAHLQIKNPLIVDSVLDYNNFIQKVKDDGDLVTRDRKRGKYDSQLLLELGYDGVIGKDEIVVFDSSQIRMIPSKEYNELV